MSNVVKVLNEEKAYKHGMIAGEHHTFLTAKLTSAYSLTSLTRCF